MPYATGLANSATDLRTAVVSAATAPANGWIWDGTNEMLYKAPVFVKLTVSGLELRAQGALGYSGGTLTSPSGQMSCITDRFTAPGTTVLSYPVTYHVFIHSSPDDIVIAVNYGAVWWQWLGFGNAVAEGGGTANPLWQWGSSNASQSSWGIALDVTGSGGGGGGRLNSAGAPFWRSVSSNTGAGVQNSLIHTGGVDSAGVNGWYRNSSGAVLGAGTATCTTTLPGLLATQPNTWNGEALLLRIRPTIWRPSNFQSYVAEFPHMRMTRNDNFIDGEILTIGSDKWFVAPVYRKNTTSRNASTIEDATHSGTIAMAIKYDGP